MNQQASEPDLSQQCRLLIGRVKSHYKLVVVFSAASLIFSLLLTVILPSRYDAHVMMLVDPSRTSIRDLERYSPLGAVEKTIIDTQVELISSPSVAKRTAEKLNESNVELDGYGPLMRIVNRLRLGISNESKGSHRAWTALSVRDGSMIDRVGQTAIIDVSFRSLDPSRAATIANTLAETAVATQMEAAKSANEAIVHWVADEVAKLDVEAKHLESQLDKITKSGLDAGSPTILRDVERRSAALKSSIIDMQKRRFLAQQKATFPLGEITIVSVATKPERRTSPNRLVIIVAMLLAGFGAGVILAWFRG